MTRGLIDANIVILRDWLSPDVLPDQVAISAVTLAELSVGPHAVLGDDEAARIERARRTAILQRAESEFDPLPLYTTNPDDFAGLGDYLTMVPVPRPPTGPRL